MYAQPIPVCSECQSITRRGFVKGAAATLAGAAMVRPALAADRTSGETLVSQLYKSLTEPQKKVICFPFGHELQSKVDNNWFIVDKTIEQVLNPDQRDLVRQIFRSIHSEEYADAVFKQVEHDAGGDGFDSCAVAIFGEPGTGKFQWVLTGRHVTRRCDGDSVEGAAFGGPIFYGHAAEGFNEKPDHPGNIYWYQARQANEVFKALDGRQRKLALREDARPEQKDQTVRLQGKGGQFHGIPGTELSSDQQELVRRTLADVLAPFRKADADETLKLIEANGGIEALHMAFYKNMDIGDDGVWDVWQIEGPNTLWYFRGKPHVHTWVHVRG
jgi:hypothetical protein